MPRKAKRTDTYSNRTDLQQAPVKAAPGQAYGERGAQEASQRDMPMAGGGASASPPGSFEDVLAAAQEAPFDPIALGAPTGRPYEPVTAGLSTGPGPGPEALRKPGSQASDVLTALADSLGTPDLQLLAERARSRGR